MKVNSNVYVQKPVLNVVVGRQSDTNENNFYLKSETADADVLYAFQSAYPIRKEVISCTPEDCPVEDPQKPKPVKSKE